MESSKNILRYFIARAYIIAKFVLRLKLPFAVCKKYCENDKPTINFQRFSHHELKICGKTSLRVNMFYVE